MISRVISNLLLIGFFFDLALITTFIEFAVDTLGSSSCSLVYPFIRAEFNLVLVPNLEYLGDFMFIPIFGVVFSMPDEIKLLSLFTFVSGVLFGTVYGRLKLSMLY